MPNWKKVIVSGSDATLNSLNVVSGSILSGSITATGSFNLNGNQTITGSLNISGSTTATSFTGSLFGTASYATNALTASFALNGGGGGLSALYIQDEGVTQGTASYINFIGTGVTATVTSGTASVSITGGGGTGEGQSVVHTQASPSTTWTFNHNLNSQYLVYDVYDNNSNAIIPANVSASNANTLIITFGVATAGYAVATVGGGLPFISASFNGYVLTASGSTAAWAPTSSLSVLSASYATTASFVTLAQTASYVVTAQTASFVATASYANNADLLDGLNSTIFATTGSNTFIGTQTITGSILQSGSFTSTGTITAQTLVVQTITSSIVYSSGSNIFGNSLANTQVLTGSILTTGSLNANNVLYVTGSNVGIGTTAPGGNLEITGFKSSPSTNPLLLLSNTANPVADAYMVRAFSDSDNNGAGKREEFFLRSDGLVYFRGNVGIGTTSPSAKLDVNGNSIITGSLTVITGSGVEFQVTNTGVKIGNVITDVHTVTGSLNISGSTTSTSFTGSLFGTSSYASNALTSSYALVATSASYAATASVSSTTFGIGATIQTYGSVASSVTGSNNIFTQNTGSFTSAFFKYTAASGSNTRAGEVISVWNSTTTSYTDFSTVDIGNTNNVTASISIVTGQVQFNIQTNSSGWAIKSIATFM